METSHKPANSFSFFLEVKLEVQLLRTMDAEIYEQKLSLAGFVPVILTTCFMLQAQLLY